MNKTAKKEMKIGIIVAMDKEYAQLKEVAQSIEKHEIVLAKCGIGKVNAALGAQQMINEHKPDVIISSGCAGGNGDDINIQDVVVSTELVYHDVYCGKAIDDTTIYGQVQGLPARFDADARMLEVAKSLIPQPSTVNRQPSINTQHPSPINLHPGLIVTGDWFVDSKEKAREIIGHFPEAKAIDMESAAIAQTCYINKVPFISFRIISDIPLRDTDASQYHDFWNTIANRSFQVTKTFIESL